VEKRTASKKKEKVRTNLKVDGGGTQIKKKKGELAGTSPKGATGEETPPQPEG